MVQVAEFKKAGSWEEKSGKLIKKRGRVILATLLLTLAPVTLESLVQILGYNSKERFRDNYLKPLKDNRLINYTKEALNDPNQEYVISERGRMFLGGSSV